MPDRYDAQTGKTHVAPIVADRRGRLLTPSELDCDHAEIAELDGECLIERHVDGAGVRAGGDDLSGAQAFVARGETPIGIVYETDAKVEPKVKIVGVFPDGSHPPVVYPVAATTTAKADAMKYLNFLRGSEAKAIFDKYGFNGTQFPKKQWIMTEANAPRKAYTGTFFAARQWR